MNYQVIAPITMPIDADTYTDAVKKFIKIKRDNTINQIIIADQMNHQKFLANIDYFQQGGKNRMRARLYPTDYTYIPPGGLPYIGPGSYMMGPSTSLMSVPSGRTSPMMGGPMMGGPMTGGPMMGGPMMGGPMMGGPMMGGPMTGGPGVLLGPGGQMMMGAIPVTSGTPVATDGTCFPKNTIIRDGTYFPRGTVLSKGTVFPNGTVIEKGTIFTKGTKLPERIKIIGGSVIPKDKTVPSGYTIPVAKSSDESPSGEPTIIFKAGTIIPPGTIFASGTILTPGTELPDGTILADDSFIPDDFELARGSFLPNDSSFEDGSSLPKGFKLDGSIIARGTLLLGGCIFPPSTILPLNTFFPKGTYINLTGASDITFDASGNRTTGAMPFNSRILPGTVVRNVTLPKDFVFSMGSEFGPNSEFKGSNLPQNTQMLPPGTKSTGRMMVPIPAPITIGMSYPFGYDGRISPKRRR